MNRIALFTLLITALSVNSLSAAGRTTFPVTKTQMEPRNLALGGAVIADNAWSGGVLVNPASGAGDGKRVYVSLAKHSLDMWSGWIAGSYPVLKKRYINTVGFYLSSFNYGELDYSERGVGNTGETFTAGEYVLAGFAAGEVTHNLNWGASAKFIWGQLENEGATGAALDLGVTWDTNWHDFNVGASIRNIGKQFSSYGADNDPLPTELIFGGRKSLNHLPLTLHVAGIFSKSGEEDWTIEELPGSPGIGFGAGGEFRIKGEDLQQPVFLRFGYRSRGQGMQSGADMDTIAGFTFGIGFSVKIVQFNYVFAPMGMLGDMHRFGITGNL